jgi:hypothetical protein
MARIRAAAWALLAIGIVAAGFGLLRADAAADCAALPEQSLAVRCEAGDYWLTVTILGVLAAFVGVALLVAPRWRSRIV